MSGEGLRSVSKTASGESTTAVKRLKLEDGTESLPSLAFLNEAATGLYRPSDTEVAVTNNGTESVRFSEGVVSGPVSFKGAHGSVTSPTFTGETAVQTGLYFPSTTQCALSVSGVAQLTARSTGVTLAGLAVGGGATMTEFSATGNGTTYLNSGIFLDFSHSYMYAKSGTNCVAHIGWRRSVTATTGLVLDTSLYGTALIAVLKPESLQTIGIICGDGGTFGPSKMEIATTGHIKIYSPVTGTTTFLGSFELYGGSAFYKVTAY